MKILPRLIYYLIFANLILNVNAQDFHQGPYGEKFYDIAGPFILPDLNSSPPCDVNNDGVLNIQDIILMVNNVLILVEFDESQIESADVNGDGLINISDVVIAVTFVLDDVGPIYNFQDEWNGNESYLFIHYSAGVGNSSALWNSNTKEEFLENSPLNVHYFFLSNGNNPEQNVIDMKEQFDNIIEYLSDDMQDHWSSHLHFVPDRSSGLGNWIENVVSDKYAFAIDRFQRIREIGYLGNPNGFTGTHMSFLAHEPHYFNYEWSIRPEPIEEDFIEFTIFDTVHHPTGWGAMLIDTVTFPEDAFLSTVTKMEIDLNLLCWDSAVNMWTDESCDDYDRTAKMYICEMDGSSCMEIARWITPFGRHSKWLMDISPFISMLRPGGDRFVKFSASGWPNTHVTAVLRFYQNHQDGYEVFAFEPLWNWNHGFNDTYNDLIDPVIFIPPEDAVNTEFVTYITGHGMACDVGNCAEFCNSKHFFEVNGGYTFDKSHPEANLYEGCLQIEKIQEGTVPNQWGTWGYGRAGWCPGLKVDPFIYDISEHIYPGIENIISYWACWAQSQNVCHEDVFPTPIDCGGGYAGVIHISSYIVYYR